MKDKDGNRLYKRVFVSVQLPGHKWKNRKWIAPVRQGWNDKRIKELIDNIAHAIEKDFPVWNYRLVKLAPDWFKFVNEGIKDEFLEALKNETTLRIPYPTQPNEVCVPESSKTS